MWFLNWLLFGNLENDFVNILIARHSSTLKSVKEISKLVFVIRKLICSDNVYNKMPLMAFSRDA